MPLAQKADVECVECGSSEVWTFTKAGESVQRMECDDCHAEWSQA